MSSGAGHYISQYLEYYPNELDNMDEEIYDNLAKNKDISYVSATTENIQARYLAPTYGMYQVCADINNVEYREVLLNDHFDFHADDLLAVCDDHTKVVWLCSPNNPTGNSLSRDEMLRVINEFQGIVVVDEAYIDFAQQMSLRPELPAHPNLIILQTMSKAWASAAIRMGMAFASKEIIALYNKVKYPYNVNLLTQQQAIEMLSDPFEVDKWVKTLLTERTHLMQAFDELPICVSAEHPELKLDFSDYSFGYIAGWSSGKETAELKASLGRIQATASEMISEIEGHLQELQKAEQLQAVDKIDQKAAAMQKEAAPIVAEPAVIQRPSVLQELHKETQKSAGNRKTVPKRKEECL